MNKESKEEACAILAQEYADIAKASGFNHDDVYSLYMNRCMTRNEEVVAEQVMREAYQMTRQNPEMSWMHEWSKEREKRLEIESRYKSVTSKIKKEALKNTDNEDSYLRSYGSNLKFL